MAGGSGHGEFKVKTDGKDHCGRFGHCIDDVTNCGICRYDGNGRRRGLPGAQRRYA